MSLFKFVKYSSLLFFLGKYKTRLFRVAAVALFAGVTSLLYGDVVAYLEQSHPETVIYALIGKILIVYGALAFVLWQFRPLPEAKAGSSPAVTKPAPTQPGQPDTAAVKAGPLAALEDVEQRKRLKSRYEKVLEKEPLAPTGRPVAVHTGSVSLVSRRNIGFSQDNASGTTDATIGRACARLSLDRPALKGIYNSS